MRLLLSIAAVTICGAMPVASAKDEQPVKPAPTPVGLSWPAVARPVRLVAAIPPEADAKGGPLLLVKPLGVMVGSGGRVFVADPGRRALIVYHPVTGVAGEWKGNAAHPLVGPVAMAEHDGRVFAVDSYQARIVVFDNNGAPVAEFGSGLLKRPEGIAINPDSRRIYVGDVRLHQIFVFHLGTLKLEKTIGGSPGKQFDSPAQVTVNSKGHLLISDGWKCGVSMLNGDGVFIRRFPTQCAKPGEFGRPNAIAVDAEDRVYVASAHDESLQIFDPEGKPLQYVRSLGKASKPAPVRTGIAVDREARVYVVDQRPDAGRLQIFAQSRETRRSR